MREYRKKEDWMPKELGIVVCVEIGEEREREREGEMEKASD